MDNFLANLYEEEQEKIAAADLGEYMGTLPTDELEEFLGLSKVAVSGPDEAPLPDAEKGQLEKDQKKADADVAKVQDLSPPKRKEAMINRIQKIAAVVNRQSVEMDKTSAAKAEIVMRATRVTRGAPPHIKAAGAKLAGKEMAKVAKDADGKDYSVRPGGWLTGQKAMTRALSGSDAKSGGKVLAAPELIGERTIGGLKGGLKGLGIGVGTGAVSGANICVEQRADQARR